MRKQYLSTTKFGTFSNGGLSSGLAFIELEDDEIKELVEHISKVEARIKAEADKTIYRLDSILKEELNIIPTSEGFAKWFFDKTSIRFRNKPITDDDIIEYSYIYLDEVREKILARKKISIERIAFHWKSDDRHLSEIYASLIREEFIASDTILDDFLSIFNLGTSRTVAKIVWVKRSTRNKEINKKSLFDFISILEENNHIDKFKKDADRFKAISASFVQENGISIDLTPANKTARLNFSEFRRDLERIISNS